MLKSRKTRSKLALTMAAALASGSLLDACNIRLHNAIISGTKGYVYNLFDPALYTDLFGDLFGTTSG